MRQILLGTTNPAKADYFARILEGYDVSFLTLGDLDIRKIPEEAGSSPLENAQAKAGLLRSVLGLCPCGGFCPVHPGSWLWTIPGSRGSPSAADPTAM